MTLTWEQLKEKGNEQYKAKNYQSAIQFYTDGIELNSDQDVLYANRALCYKALANYRLALKDLERALNLYPTNIKNLKRKYDILLIMGNFGEAESTIQKCINIEPKQYSHKTDLQTLQGTIYNFNNFFENYNQENYEKAETFGVKLIDICYGNPQFKAAYMDTLINNNNLQEATKFWTNKCTDSEKSDDEFVYLICKVFYYEGNYEKAKKFLGNLLRRVNDNSKYNQLYHYVCNIEREKENANKIFKANKYQEAIDAYTKLVELDPKNKCFNATIYANRGLCKIFLN